MSEVTFYIQAGEVRNTLEKWLDAGADVPLKLPGNKFGVTVGVDSKKLFVIREDERLENLVTATVDDHGAVARDVYCSDQYTTKEKCRSGNFSNIAFLHPYGAKRAREYLARLVHQKEFQQLEDEIVRIVSEVDHKVPFEFFKQNLENKFSRIRELFQRTEQELHPLHIELSKEGVFNTSLVKSVLQKQAFRLKLNGFSAIQAGYSAIKDKKQENVEEKLKVIEGRVDILLSSLLLSLADELDNPLLKGE